MVAGHCRRLGCGHRRHHGGPAARPAAAAAQALTTLDLSAVHAYDVRDSRQALLAYGWLHAAATVQGIVNRDGPALFVDFLRGDERGDLRIDQYWLQRAAAAGWPSTDDTRTVADIPGAVATFRSRLAGAVVWDPAVPATSNVASTVAGADDLVAVPYDVSPGSAYSQLVDPTGTDPQKLRVRTWLVNHDGSSLFTGRGAIPGTGRRSTGSAKADAYLWAVDRYLATGRSNPAELAFFLDAYWLSQVPKSIWPYPIQNSLLSNHDFLVARRGFVFDLSLWPDEAPEDDRSQAPGTDLRVLEEILATAARRAGHRNPAIRGFVPWAFKYTSAASQTSRQLAGHAEWKFVEIATSYGCYLDADAEGLDPMANASLFTHYPVPTRYRAEPAPTTADLRQRGFLDASGAVVPKRYVLIYTGDYDSAAWLYHMLPRVWDDPARGSIPLNWAFNPDLDERMPLGLVHARETATANDHFISGDSGSGYVSPGALEQPTAHVGGALRTWTARNVAAFRRWGLDVTGFVIDGTAPPLTLRSYEQSYGAFSPAGVVTSTSYPNGVFGRTPFVRMGGDLSGAGSLIDEFGRDSYETNLTEPPLRPQFTPVRTILKTPGWHSDLMASFAPDLPPPPFTGERDVDVVLGDPNVANGLTQVDQSDGATVPVTVAGRSARSTAPGGNPAGNRYLYFAVDDAVAHDSAFHAVFTVDYLDSGSTAFNLQYDGTDPFAGAGSVSRGDTGQWKTATLTVPDARFANREQGRFDLRFELAAGSPDLVVSRVAVAITAQQTYPDAQIEFCAAPTFFALLGRHLRGQLVPECSAGILVPGATTDVVFRLRNHGDRAATPDIALAGPDGTTVTGPTRVAVPARGDTRVAFAVTTPVDASASSAGRLLLTLGSGAGARRWPYVPAYSDIGYRDADEVSVELGAANTEKGVGQVDLGFDGLTTAGTVAGRGYRVSTLRQNGFTDEGYLYFAVDDTFLADEDGADVQVGVDYLDEPGMTFRLDYDALDRARMLDGVLTPTPEVSTTGTGRWVTATFRLTRVAFADRISGSPDGRSTGVVDFRIATASPLKVAAVRVRRG